MKRSGLQQLMLKYPGPWHISLIIERLLARELKSLNYDPHVQYRFHQFFMVLWSICIGAMPFFPGLYNHQIGTLIIQEISFYANFATDFGAMSAALAAGNYHCPGCTCQETDTTVAVTKRKRPAVWSEATAELVE